MSFEDALLSAEGQFGKAPHLLLGNGFSIACRPDIFRYGKLFEQADFSKLSPYVKPAFEALKTQDFEEVIRVLRSAHDVLKAYGANGQLLAQLKTDADSLRELLVQTIAQSHPALPSDIAAAEYEACKTFLERFDKTFTFSYDLLLYWTHMQNPEGVDPVSDDGFRGAEDPDAPYVTWEPTRDIKQTIYFLHGALHIFDAGHEVQKYTWKRTGVPLITQIREALEAGKFPIFVSEGTSKEKLKKIKHSDYLSRAFVSFSRIQNCLFVHGHSLADNDEHYLRCIEKGKVTKVFIGIHGDPDSPASKKILARGEKMAAARTSTKFPLEVEFYDAGTASVWGH